ncbi:MAG: cobyric acid synthase [Clostridia bacterium]|nr:cobyric acid synthase [Clostridia bacterium]MCI1999469.1 cobyric acid synthase [Clostridia bacterium]MCI2014152.1 cobyric acid synthase [Clostridia bacterium]
MAKKIMIQGTMSNAGKSFLCTALCRIFTQDGYRVRPFKSQNMALNSFITKDGSEIGRAQAVQAEACKTEPTSYMNPVLLKPTTDVGSQVIVNGRVLKNMSASDYYKFKKELIPDVLHAFKELEKEADIIVIEGAGSPAEINLKKDDFVNMGLAKMLNSPVLLAGDIDRGGVFAQLYGTVMLLDNNERNFIKGLVINKFRGDKKILEPGLKTLEDLCKIPVMGVIDYINVDIDDEDSLSSKLENETKTNAIDVAVIRLPKISNFTDFSPLENIENVSVRYVKKRGQLKNPDLIIIPGSKSTISDLKWMRQNGIEGEIKKAGSKNTPIIGICGGYQMLGNLLSDPYNTEGGGKINGLGLLPIDTVFEEEKNQRQTSGKVCKLDGIFGSLSGRKFHGYEIHMGKTTCNSGLYFSKTDDLKNDGCVSENVFGTYIHGIFDSQDMIDGMEAMLCKIKGIEKGKEFDYQSYREKQYDLLADNVRKSIDLDLIYEIMGMK